MLNDPLKISKEGLSSLTDSEFAEQRKKLLQTLTTKKSTGKNTDQDELLYKAFQTESKRRAKQHPNRAV